MSVYHYPSAWRRSAPAAAAAVTLAVLIGASFPQSVIRAQSKTPGKPAAPTTKRPADWDRFTADITLKRSHVDGKGQRRQGSPDVQYHWERTKNGAGWKTSLTLVSRGQQIGQSANGPQSIDVPSTVARMEDDGDGSPLRFYAPDGKEIRVPTPKELASLMPGGTVAMPQQSSSAAALQPAPIPTPGATGRDWADSILTPPAKKDDRRKSFERQFGRAKGQVHKLDRYVSASGDGEREVLVHPEHAVPMEINVSRGGKLLSHTSFDYEAQADGALLRRRVRTEQRLSDTSEDRLISEIELSNVRFDRKAGAR